MALHLRVGNSVGFSVTLSVNEGKTDKKYKFWFDANRLNVEQWDAYITAEEVTGKTIIEQIKNRLLDNITNWSEQTLVIDDESGQPAEFSKAGLELVLGLWDAWSLINAAYQSALGIKDGSSLKDARAKN